MDSQFAIVMRPYPARGGTQVQVPIESQPYFDGYDSVTSSHSKQSKAFCKARARGRLNTLKVEMPECRSVTTPIVVFHKVGDTMEYSVLDGDNEGASFLDSLVAGLDDGSTRRSNSRSTMWRVENATTPQIVEASAPLEMKAKYRRWAVTPEGELLKSFDIVVGNGSVTQPKIDAFDGFEDARKGRTPRKYSRSENRDSNMLAQQGYCCAVLPEATKGTALAWIDPTSPIDGVRMVEITFEGDHLIPRCVDGSDDDANRPMVCKFINQFKGSKLIVGEDGAVLPIEEIRIRIRTALQRSGQRIISFHEYHEWLAKMKVHEALQSLDLAAKARTGTLQYPWLKNGPAA